MPEPTQQQLAHIHTERDAYVARWLKERPSVDLREALTAAFSAGATSALTHTTPPRHPSQTLGTQQDLS